MRKPLGLSAVVIVLAGCSLFLTFYAPSRLSAVEPESLWLLMGSVFDRQNNPIEGADVTLQIDSKREPVAETTTQADGRFVFSPPDPVPTGDLSVHIKRAHFEKVDIELDKEQLASLHQRESIILSDTILMYRVDFGFWIATAIFVAVLVLIATGMLHNTLAALVGTTLIFGISYLGPLLREDLFIFNFSEALRYVDWNVVFLIMGMMIVIAVVERTGIFQWLAFGAYQMSRGRAWRLMLILVLVTGVASALLDNVTTMLLMTPITVQIALALAINPLALLIPEVLASNLAGISTLIGTPTNILIGSFAEISFNNFLINQTPGVLLAFAGLVIYSNLIYRRDLRAASDASPMLIERLAERAQITEPVHLRKAGWVGAGMLVLFVFGERIHLLPAVTALMGATVLLVWIRPDIEEMIEAVDWTTLVFFITLFIVVGAIQEVGLISRIADMIAHLVGTDLVLAMVVVIWSSALLSTVVANIPFTAAMLPVIAYLSTTVPNAQSKVLFYCLSVGSAMGGNGSLIGASANMVMAGIAERAGYPITYVYFLKKGFPALVISVGLATLWLVIRFLVLA
jgi:Na+/H+ antiporter NhaD/arsenite permease-like protein